MFNKFFQCFRKKNVNPIKTSSSELIGSLDTFFWEKLERGDALLEGFDGSFYAEAHGKHCIVKIVFRNQDERPHLIKTYKLDDPKEFLHYYELIRSNNTPCKTIEINSNPSIKFLSKECFILSTTDGIDFYSFPGKKRYTLSSPNTLFSQDVSSIGKFLTIYNKKDNKLEIRNIHTGKLFKKMPIKLFSPTALCAFKNHKALLINNSGNFEIYNFTSGLTLSKELSGKVPLKKPAIYAIKVLKDGAKLAIHTLDLTIFDCKTQRTKNIELKNGHARPALVEYMIENILNKEEDVSEEAMLNVNRQ